jgi:hypothetical protein
MSIVSTDDRAADEVARLTIDVTALASWEHDVG